MIGKVLEFEEFRGRGVVTAADGTRYPFHATSVADGSRTVPIDAEVEFEVAAGLPGSWEAVAVRRVSR